MGITRCSKSFAISDDRWFLDRIAAQILAFEGYENDKEKRLGAEAVESHGLKFKQLRLIDK